MRYSPVLTTRRGVPLIRLPWILKGSDLKYLLSFSIRHGIKVFFQNSSLNQTQVKVLKQSSQRNVFVESSFPMEHDVQWNIWNLSWRYVNFTQHLASLTQHVTHFKNINQPNKLTCFWESTYATNVQICNRLTNAPLKIFNNLFLHWWNFDMSLYFWQVVTTRKQPPCWFCQRT